jgi:prepilin-type N-terminal cleavage/methylation domain-containing protein
LAKAVSAARHAADAFTLVELLFVMAISGTLTAIAVPQLLRGLDDARASGAARSLAARLGEARTDAVRRSTFVGLRFEPGTPDYLITKVIDGNGNGLRTTDLQDGVDLTITTPQPLGWQYPGVVFGLLPGVPEVDGTPASTNDGVRAGTSRILSMNPNGSSSSGTLYVHGRKRSQYAVRVLGATGRVRVLKYEWNARRWMQQ